MLYKPTEVRNHVTCFSTSNPKEVEQMKEKKTYHLIVLRKMRTAKTPTSGKELPARTCELSFRQNGQLPHVVLIGYTNIFEINYIAIRLTVAVHSLATDFSSICADHVFILE